MPELSSYTEVTTLAADDRLPVITNPGVAGGNQWIRADNLALFTGGGSGGTSTADSIRHVSTTGSDANDGLSWDTAFLTIQAGIDSLGGQGGVVNVGAGPYVITTPIIIPGWTIIQGAGSNPGAQGTTVKAHATFTGVGLFQTSTWTLDDWWHWGSLRDMYLDGNDIATCLIAVHQMGEASDFRNLMLENHMGRGIWATGSHAPFTLYNCTVYGNGATANYGIHFDVHPTLGGYSAGVCRLFGLAGDGNLLALVRISGWQQVMMDGVKCEAHPASMVLIDGSGVGGVAPQLVLSGGIIQNTPAGTTAVVKIAGTAQPSIVMIGFGFDADAACNLINDTVQSVTIPTIYGTYARKSLVTYGADILLGGNVGFHSQPPVARSTGWTMSNVTTDKVLNANATTIDELADVLGTLITYLISRGDLAA